MRRPPLRFISSFVKSRSFTYGPKGLYSFIVLFILEVSRTLIPVFHCRLNLAPSITQYVPTTSAYTSKISKQSDVG